MGMQIQTVQKPAQQERQIIKGISNADAGLISGAAAVGSGLFTLMRTVDRHVGKSVLREVDTALKSGKNLSQTKLDSLFTQFSSARNTLKGSKNHVFIGTALTIATGLFSAYCYKKAQ